MRVQSESSPDETLWIWLKGYMPLNVLICFSLFACIFYLILHQPHVQHLQNEACLDWPKYLCNLNIASCLIKTPSIVFRQFYILCHSSDVLSVPEKSQGGFWAEWLGFKLKLKLPACV
ncbi:hypothetical protein AMECASPLE_012357 [Ameca splendens]|uniref:Uncharacterized protein n=1 Tax=Ameca splendens TaxID=208324 RepID=A0ABV0XQ44_9TELE